VSTYRLDLFKAFQSKYPQFPVTIQNLADQRRAIMKKNYIPSAILEKIKNDVKLELSINYSDNNEVSNNLLQNSVEPQSLQSLSNHNDSFCPILDSPNTIQTDIHNLDLSYNDIHVDVATAEAGPVVEPDLWTRRWSRVGADRRLELPPAPRASE
jgi:hypothetical protein